MQILRIDIILMLCLHSHKIPLTQQGYPLTVSSVGKPCLGKITGIQQDKALPGQLGKGKKLSQSGISMVFQNFFVRV